MTKKRDIHGVQGEGNREADRRYREGVKEFEREGRVSDAAREARDELHEEEAEDAEATPKRVR